MSAWEKVHCLFCDKYIHATNSLVCLSIGENKIYTGWHGGRMTEDGENVWNWKVFQLKTMRVLRRWISCTTHTIAIINGTRGTAAAAATRRRTQHAEDDSGRCKSAFHLF